MSDINIDYSHSFCFYDEKKFRKILQTKPTIATVERYGREMLEWMDASTSLADKEPENSYCAYYKLLDNNTNSICITKDYINHVFTTFRRNLDTKLNNKNWKLDKQTQENLLRFYVYFKANVINREYWFTVTQILMTEEMIAEMKQASKTFNAVLNSSNDDDSIALVNGVFTFKKPDLQEGNFSYLNETPFQSIPFLSGSVCGKIGKELAGANASKKGNAYRDFIYPLFAEKNVMGLLFVA